jgi:hypothetical protein
VQEHQSSFEQRRWRESSFLIKLSMYLEISLAASALAYND